MKSRKEDAITKCYVFANNIKRRDFYSAITSRESVFGYDKTFSTRNKLITDLRGILNSSLSVSRDQPVPFRTILAECSALIVQTCDEIVERLELNIKKKDRTAKCKNHLKDMAGIGSGNELLEIVYALQDIQIASRFDSIHYIKEMVIYLARTCKALDTLNCGTSNERFNNLITKLLDVEDYFVNGYPMDLLVFDREAVDNISKSKVESVWYKPDYCSTYLQHLKTDKPVSEGLVECKLS